MSRMQFTLEELQTLLGSVRVWTENLDPSDTTDIAIAYRLEQRLISQVKRERRKQK